MVRSKLSLNKWVWVTCIFLCAATSQADSVFSNLEYSARVRPLAAAEGIVGAEFFATTLDGYFIGPTFHFFSENNDPRDSALKGEEFGIKFGRVFPDGMDHQGFFVMGNLNYLNATISNYYIPTGQTFKNKANIWYEALFVGYQFNSLIFGPNQWDVRLGAGLVSRPAESSTYTAVNSDKVNVGIRDRLDPTLEFSIGYVFK